MLALVALHRIDIITFVGVVEPNVHRMGSIVRLLASTRSSSQLKGPSRNRSSMSLGSTALRQQFYRKRKEGGSGTIFGATLAWRQASYHQDLGLARCSVQLWGCAEHRTTLRLSTLAVALCENLSQHAFTDSLLFCSVLFFSSFLFCARKLCPKRETSQNSKKI